MFVDFGMAVQYDGVCYLRFDDTNPEAEKQEYIDHIEVGRGALGGGIGNFGGGEEGGCSQWVFGGGGRREKGQRAGWVGVKSKEQEYIDHIEVGVGTTARGGGGGFAFPVNGSAYELHHLNS